MATAPSESQAQQTAHEQALDAVFAELSTPKPPPPKQPPKPAKIAPQVGPLHEQSEAQVDYTPARTTGVASHEEPAPDWTSRLRRALCVGFVLLGAFFFYRGMPQSWRAAISPSSDAPTAAASAAPVSHSGGEKQLRTKRIEDVRLGDRLAGRNPIREQAELIEPDPATWRQVDLYMTKENGLGLWIGLLRPREWIEAHGAKPGSTIYIELYEMGAVGDAEVTYVGPCPEIQPGNDGTVVIGTFKHQADKDSNLVRLELEDQLERTGVTDNHPYWSVDRQAFVEVGDLRVGELVDSEYGLKHVVSVTPIEYSEFLYNVETTEHVYRVGSLGTLVHNSCVVLQSRMHTLDMSNSVWRRTKFSQEGLVYVLRDAKTGELLKVGQTKSATFVGRFEKYVSAARRNGRELAIDAFEVPLAQRGVIEGEIRRNLGSMFPLPWDNTGRRLGVPGPGVP